MRFLLYFLSLHELLLITVANHNIYLNIAILVEYFYSGRPYKVILQRLYLVHGIKRRCGLKFIIIIMKIYFGILILDYPG